MAKETSGETSGANKYQVKNLRQQTVELRLGLKQYVWEGGETLILTQKQVDSNNFWDNRSGFSIKKIEPIKKVVTAEVIK
jgi:hypothetical protein